LGDRLPTRWERTSWDTQGKSPEFKALDQPAADIAVTPQGPRSLTIDKDGAHLSDTLTGERVQSLAHRAAVRWAAFAGALASAAVWDSESGKKLSSLGNWEWVDYACLSPDSRRVAMVSRNGWVIVWDIAKDREVRTLWHQGAVLHAAFSRDGKRLATAGTDRQARVWDVESGKDAAPPLWHEDTVSRVAFSPDGAYVLTASEDRLARLWNITTGREAAALPHPRRVRYAAFSRDRKMLLTASDRQLAVWDIAALPQVPTTPRMSLAHDDLVLYGEFSQDGRSIVSVDFHATARVWNVKTGQERTELRRLEIRLARLSPDGRRMATAGRNRPHGTAMESVSRQ